MKDTLTLNANHKRMTYGDTYSYPHRMDYIRITENLSNRRGINNRDNGLSGSPAMWWVAAGIVILSALFLIGISLS